MTPNHTLGDEHAAILSNILEPPPLKSHYFRLQIKNLFISTFRHLKLTLMLLLVLEFRYMATAETGFLSIWPPLILSSRGCGCCRKPTCFEIENPPRKYREASLHLSA